MQRIARLAGVSAGGGRRPLKTTLKRRLVSRASICGPSATALHHRQAPPFVVVGEPMRLSFSSKSDVDSEHVVSEGGLLLPRHQVNTSGARGVQEISVNRSGLLPTRAQYRYEMHAASLGKNGTDPTTTAVVCGDHDVGWKVLAGSRVLSVVSTHARCGLY